ncbi:MAG: dethiobiotin synthase [Rugosibacter sp.]|nr:dethiobiotin synthase [Rugosibacter sp.]
MSAYFITGTGTDIGKTWLSCALLRHWRAEGCVPQAFKPVLSGFDMATAETSDAGQLLAALGREIDAAALDDIAPWRFSAPLSPDMAAAREGRHIDFDALVSFTRRCFAERTRSIPVNTAGHAIFPVLIEGVGGVMVPLNETHTVRDWVAASGLPCVLVAGSYLGSLSHTLTALESLRKVGAGVTAIVVNESPGSPVSLADTIATLRHHVGGVDIVAISRDAPQPGIEALAFLLS